MRSSRDIIVSRLQPLIHIERLKVTCIDGLRALVLDVIIRKEWLG